MCLDDNVINVCGWCYSLVFSYPSFKHNVKVIVAVTSEVIRIRDQDYCLHKKRTHFLSSCPKSSQTSNLHCNLSNILRYLADSPKSGKIYGFMKDSAQNSNTLTSSISYRFKNSSKSVVNFLSYLSHKKEERDRSHSLSY